MIIELRLSPRSASDQPLPAGRGFGERQAEPRAGARPLQDNQLVAQGDIFSSVTAVEWPRRARRKVQAPRMRIIAAPNGEG
jgi:hypothetical protein